MKTKLFKISILFLAIFVGLSSCKKDEKAIDDKNDTDFYFTAKIDGKSFTGDLSKTEKFKATKAAHGNMSTLTVSVTEDDSADPTADSFLINLANYTGAKTYTITSARYRSEKSNWGPTAESPGSVVITSDKNNVVQGTFSFDGYNEEDKTTKKITEGKFRLKVKP